MKILKSQITAIADFELLVASHAKLLREWKEHQKKVDADEKSNVPADKKHISYKRPKSHEVIEASINESGDVDYEIVDDGPSASQQLEAQKLDLERRLHLAVDAAIESVAPRRKIQLGNIRENDIVSRHAARVAQAQSQGFVRSLLSSSPQMPNEDAEFLNEQQRLRARISEIRRSAAEALTDIDDLTTGTIGAWKIPSFS